MNATDDQPEARRGRARTSCCGATNRTIVDSERIHIVRCEACGTLWGDHVARPDGRPWDESYIPEDFAVALRQRRVAQAGTIVDLLRASVVSEPVLDYGTGQGVFLAAMLSGGIEAVGCDLDLDAPHSVAPRDRLIKLSGPWQLPEGEFGTVVMLDVLEHHHDPVGFLTALRCDHLVLKVPTAFGPSARAARLAARAGKTGLLEQLFLVGENFPHRWLATRRGLATMALRSGWTMTHHRPIVEVGTELPVRMRGAGSMPVVRWALWVAGAGLGAVGNVWSDAEVAVFTRATSPD